MKKLYATLLLTLYTHHAYAPCFGTCADQQATIAAVTLYQQQTNYTIPQPNAIIGNSACPTPACAIPIPLPSFTITLQNYLGNTINTFTFPTNTNFKSSLAILSVQIFPTSNFIGSTAPGVQGANTTTTVVPVSADNSYAIFYTLQSPDGVYIQTAVQYPSSALTPLFPIGQNVQYTTTTNGLNVTEGTAFTVTAQSGSITFPATIILSVSGALTPTGAPIPLTQTTVFPNFTGTLAVNQQEIINGLCPLTQKFLIATNPSGTIITAVPMSGNYNTVSNTTMPPVLTSIVPASTTSLIPATTVGDAILPISITLYNGTTPYTITFDAQPLSITTQTLPQGAAAYTYFNEEDLQNGLFLYLYVYPPLYYNGTTSNTFTFAAALKTLDGMKFNKIINQAVPFTYLPITYNITASSLEGSSTSFTSTIANTALTQQIYNILSPMSLRFLIMQNTSNEIVIAAF